MFLTLRRTRHEAFGNIFALGLPKGEAPRFHRSTDCSKAAAIPWAGWFRILLWLCVLPALGGCASSSGIAARAIAFPAVAAAYIPLQKSTHFGIGVDEAAAMAIAPGIAVTCAHNANLVDPAAVIGMARDYDLLFFRTRRKPAQVFSRERIGMAVTAYGQGADGELRFAHGKVRTIRRCAGCTAPAYFIFAGNAGPGFSGGPVLDGQGALIGITFGYKDVAGERLIYAYDMARIGENLQGLLDTGDSHAAALRAPAASIPR
jgi:hypothetical protein